mmetsp:Transcript_13496/g.23939  ORF Transcript_13496/g.23939 Transcript_13496/m.23939 type:complete len:263 (+) Transcript_13496:373-1161(+)
MDFKWVALVLLKFKATHHAFWTLFKSDITSTAACAEASILLENEKQHECRSVIQERLPLDNGAQAFGGPHIFQQSHDSDWIRRTDERSKHKTFIPVPSQRNNLDVTSCQAHRDHDPTCCHDKHLGKLFLDGVPIHRLGTAVDEDGHKDQQQPIRVNIRNGLEAKINDMPSTMILFGDDTCPTSYQPPHEEKYSVWEREAGKDVSGDNAHEKHAHNNKDRVGGDFRPFSDLVQEAISKRFWRRGRLSAVGRHVDWSLNFQQAK